MNDIGLETLAKFFEALLNAWIAEARQKGRDRSAPQHAPGHRLYGQTIPGVSLGRCQGWMAGKNLNGVSALGQSFAERGCVDLGSRQIVWQKAMGDKKNAHRWL